MKLRAAWIEAVLAVALLIGSVNVAGCANLEVSPVDTTLAESVDNPAEFFTGVLRAYVNEGRVDYAGLVEDKSLDAYLAWLARTDPKTLADDASRFALWINAYNAYTLKLIRDNYPVESINDLHSGGRIIGHITKKTAWDKSFAVVGGETYSLNHIEHKIIRQVFDDPRAHFALVCAAKSCPPLRSEAYEGSRLDEQLDDQARTFFAQPQNNRFDVQTRTAHISRILDWYKGDFGESDSALLLAIARYLPQEVRESIESDPGAWKIHHTHYDWDLNE